MFVIAIESPHSPSPCCSATPFSPKRRVYPLRFFLPDSLFHHGWLYPPGWKPAHGPCYNSLLTEDFPFINSKGNAVSPLFTRTSFSQGLRLCCHKRERSHKQEVSLTLRHMCHKSSVRNRINGLSTVKSSLLILCLTLISGTWSPRTLASSSVVILQYHHVSDTTPRITSVTVDTFRKHMAYLSEHQFNVIPLTEAVDSLRNQHPLPEKTVAITFDDAYLSIYTEAFPLLKKHRFPFTVFVSPTPVDKKYQKFLSWAQIQEMVRSGATIANHTLNHDHSVEKLPEESEAQWLKRFQLDLESTEKRLFEKTGQSVKQFAWTFGETTPKLRTVLSDLGYVGFGQQSGAAGELSDFTRLPRFPMAGDYGVNDFRLKVNSRALPVTHQTPDSSLISSDNLKPELELTLQPGDYQKKQLKCYASGQGELTVTWLDKAQTRLKTRANSPLPVGRTRYNCTAPSNSGRHYYWYSHAWLRLTEDGKALD